MLWIDVVACDVPLGGSMELPDPKLGLRYCSSKHEVGQSGTHTILEHYTPPISWAEHARKGVHYAMIECTTTTKRQEVATLLPTFVLHPTQKQQLFTLHLRNLLDIA